MRKLIKYPSQAIKYIKKEEFEELLTTDIENIAQGAASTPSIPVTPTTNEYP